jgi:hypothetical protein
VEFHKFLDHLCPRQASDQSASENKLMLAFLFVLGAPLPELGLADVAYLLLQLHEGRMLRELFDTILQKSNLFDVLERECVPVFELLRGEEGSIQLNSHRFPEQVPRYRALDQQFVSRLFSNF